VLGLAGCSPRRPGEKHAGSDSEFGKSSDGAATLSFMPRPIPIAEADIKETKTFDVVIGRLRGIRSSCRFVGG
jgi:hypothetical protein